METSRDIRNKSKSHDFEYNWLEVLKLNWERIVSVNLELYLKSKNAVKITRIIYSYYETTIWNGRLYKLFDPSSCFHFQNLL